MSATDTATQLVFLNSTTTAAMVTVYNLALGPGAHTYLANGMVVDTIGGIWKHAGLESPPPNEWYYTVLGTPLESPSHW